MIKRKQIRKIHKYLSIFVGIQLFLWTLSGLFFTLIPIGEIRGDHLINPAASVSIKDFNFISPSKLIEIQLELQELKLSKIQLRSRLGVPVYLIELEAGASVYDAANGQKMAPLTKPEALEVGRERSKLAILGAEYVEAVETGSEYRGGELPVWRLLLDDESHLYIGAISGQLRAVRTNNWRLFDFLWSLHIMDYEEREDFNHWLLKIVSALAIITVVSGFVLFVLTIKRKVASQVTGA